MQDSGLVSALRERLANAAAHDGGWGYYPGKASRVEPTAWALLALGSSGPPADAEPALAFLERVQQSSGLLVEPGMPGPNYAWNGLVLFALQAVPEGRSAPWVERLARALIAAKGVQLPPVDPTVFGQDNRLQGWSWTDGTFSWVEPTAWNLLAFKKAATTDKRARDRIAQAEALLVDRACEPAGWNYGNSLVLMQELRPYVSTTALALLALQDHRDLPAVADALAWLEAEATSERSAMALALAAISLTVFGRPVDTVLEPLVEQGRQTAYLGNAHLEAMALYAMTLDEHHAGAFRVA
jgi:hypothetical protein